MKLWIDDTLYQQSFEFPPFPVDSSPEIIIGGGLDGEVRLSAWGKRVACSRVLLWHRLPSQVGPVYFFKEAVPADVIAELEATHLTEK